MFLTQRLHRLWFAETVPWWGWGLWPCSQLYRGIAGALQAWQRLRAKPQPNCPPIVVVGNIVVGGQGKTPLVLAILQHYQALGYQLGVVSRGYGGKRKGCQWVQADSDPGKVGDEPVLIARQGVPVVVGRDRQAAVKLLLSKYACDFVISDDGLQHTAMHRDCEVVVTDGQTLFGNGHLLPLGPLRSPLARLQQADLLVEKNPCKPKPDSFAMQVQLSPTLYALDDPTETRCLTEFAGQQVHAVAGIGWPTHFFAALRQAGLVVLEHPFPDHHRFCSADVNFATALPILMTEKDAVKCASLNLTDAWVVTQSVTMPTLFFQALSKFVKEKSLGG